MDTGWEAPRLAQLQAERERREQMVLRELRNALARAVKQADREGLVAPVVTLRIKR